MYWLVLTLILCIFVYIVLLKPFTYWSNLGVPQYPVWILWKELLLSLVFYRTFPGGIKKIYDDFPNERYCGCYSFFKSCLFLRDPELIKQITVKDFDHFVDHYQFVAEGSEPLWEKNLFSLKGEKWKEMRSTLSPSFTSSKMKMMFEIIAECSKQFVQYFKEEEPETITVEMKDIYTRFANDVIASAAFGLNCDSLKERDNQFYLMGREITGFGGVLAIVKLILTFLCPKLTRYLGVKLFPEFPTNFFRKIIKDTLEARQKNNIVRLDMIHLLLEAQKEKENSDTPLTDEDITAQAIIFFFAGFETVSTLMCFMSYELAINPDIQERLHMEIDVVEVDCKGAVTYEALMKMKYLDMIISETLRKWSGAVMVDRECVKPYTIDGKTPLNLKKGDSVWLPIYALHHDPQYFPNPDKFDPERFSEENKRNIVPYSYLPFGSGPRNCIGNRFALMETKLLFFYLLRDFEIVAVEKTRIPLKISRAPFRMAPEGGFWLGLTERNREKSRRVSIDSKI